MRINKIELCNFGSYAGINVFDLGDIDDINKKIVLVGGKNGAGKTTLFSSVKLCIYGYHARGYQNINSHYRKEVKKYFNDLSRYEANSRCYVKVDFSLENGQAEDSYEIKREWFLHAKTLESFEKLIVWKNGNQLNGDELDDFDSFLMSLVPPELFNLFFFDGEQIADDFLNEDGHKRLKDAFLVLCGFDTLSIMEKNFKRITYGKKAENINRDEYIEYRDKLVEQKNLLDKKLDDKNRISNNIIELEDQIKSLELEYKKKGGVTQEEWQKLHSKLSDEERKREEYNAYLKKVANNIIPFILVRNKLLELKNQIKLETEKQQLNTVVTSLKEMLPGVMSKVYNRLEWMEDEELTEFVIEEFDNVISDKKLNDVSDVLNLSSKDAEKLLLLIEKYIEFDSNEIIDVEREIKNSINNSKKIREKIEKTTVDGYADYLKDVNEKLGQKEVYINLEQRESESILLLEEEIKNSEAILKKIEKKLEEDIKKKSVQDLSIKSITFLDALQAKLFQNEINKIEGLFLKKIDQIARKNNFVDDIHIDKDFNIHIYKRVEFNTLSVCEKLDEIGFSRYAEEYGITHCNGIMKATGTNTLEEFYKENHQKKDTNLSVLQEIDKSRLSKGEKQIFVMALYWAFMCLSKNEVPFMMDTPFARIDSEHRMNITKNFFMDLKGQVFIFSTNEEIVGEHYEIMKNNVQQTFLIENIDNISTSIETGVYFGGEDNAI